ncbi:hypothetical protein AMATHDRAFT_68417 [Amanita thiersii Skay4041]|uniref:Uncharacterized protein n=1 Tax=Amanita thiersii Skay4041 TaxID=703135 RepID=A0A2A9NHB2_9AGAR|nr:hypothetical protein AMATHDRAFT_68417 [Amanita thiersii Skay4041]
MALRSNEGMIRSAITLLVELQLPFYVMRNVSQRNRGKSRTSSLEGRVYSVSKRKQARLQ